jgi:glycolate oxidase
MTKLANRMKIPLAIADSAGSLCACSADADRGVILDFSGMNRIREIRAGDLFCVVEPGVTAGQLNSALRAHGFFFPVNPLKGPACSIGRIVLEGGGHSREDKYGPVRNYLLAMEAITPTGKLVRLGTKTLKNSTGPQVERVFAGSMGILGLPTEITLSVRPKPQKRALCVASFDSPKKAAAAVCALNRSSIIAASIELVMSTSSDAAGFFKSMRISGHRVVLLAELDGHPLAVKREVKEVARLCMNAGALAVKRMPGEKGIGEWGKARLRLLRSFGENSSGISVPMKKTADVLNGILRVSKKHGADIVVYGYFVRGRLEIHAAVNAGKQKGTRAEKAAEKISRLVLSLSGFSPGTPDRVSLALKRALDPGNIMNPRGISWQEA